MEKWLTPNLLRLERIGAGGMAEVYRGVQVGARGFQRAVAIKMILPVHSGNERVMQQFEQEVALYSKLNHPNIAQVYACEESASGICLVMEYVQGLTLEHILRAAVQNNLPLPPELCLYVGREALQALGFAHSLRSASGERLAVVHRDISPQNIMISFEGAIKVLDFGIARILGEETVTRTGTIKGKIAYAAPEYLRHSRFDTRSDLFSLGCVMYELITREKLVKSPDVIEAIRQLVDLNPDDLDRDMLDIGKEERQIIKTLLQPDPDKRYQEAMSATQDLSRVLQESYPNFSPASAGTLVESLHRLLAKKGIGLGLIASSATTRLTFRQRFRRFRNRILDWLSTSRTVLPTSLGTKLVLLIAFLIGNCMWVYLYLNMAAPPPNIKGQILRSRPLAWFTPATLEAAPTLTFRSWHSSDRNKNVLEQPDPDRQPRLLVAKSGQKTVLFDGLNDFFVSNSLASQFAKGQGFTAIIKGTFAGFDSRSVFALQFSDLDRDVVRLGVHDSRFFMKIAPGAVNEFIRTSEIDFKEALVVSLTLNSERATIFVDGQARAESALPGGFSLSRAAAFSIGQEYDSGNPSDFLYGTIDEMVFYARALGELERLEIEQALLGKNLQSP